MRQRIGTAANASAVISPFQKIIHPRSSLQATYFPVHQVWHQY
jgi:hypothetical protein